jgi:hypothetical protein
MAITPGLNLKQKLHSYYTSLGQRVRELPRYPAVLEARQRNEAGVERVTILCAESGSPDAPDRQRETKLIGQLGSLRDIYPHATHLLVVETLSGYSTEFKKFTRSLGVTVREEMLLFDAEFKSDVNRDASDIAREIRESAEQADSLRVAQPFRSFTGRGDLVTSGPDAVERLTNFLTSRAENARIAFLVGPAGAGKTVAFEETFRRCYESFQQKKARRLQAVRPLALTPKHLSRVRGNTLQGVIHAFLNNEIARPIGLNGLNWMIDNGQLAVMCDGLDEVLATDDQFFDFLTDRLTAVNGRGQLLVCVRDSLFNTCRNLHEFLLDATDYIDIFQLDSWSTATKRDFAHKRFSSDSRQPEGFIGVIQSHPSARHLSDNPFYCRLLADLYSIGVLIGELTESALCDRALDQMLEREYSKGVISRAKVNLTELRDVLEAAAEENLKNDFAGVPIDELRTIAEIICSAGMSVQEKDDLVMRLVQLPVFARSRDGTAVDFVHEITGFFLLARSLVRLLKRDSDEFVRKMDKASLIGRDALIRLIAENITFEGLSDRLWNLMESPRLPANSLRAILQTAVVAAPAGLPAAVKQHWFAHRSLEGVRLRNMDLREANFQNSDLTDAAFEACDLHGSSFDGAILQNTTFSGPSTSGSYHVRMDDVTRVHSIRIGKQYFDNITDIVRVLTGKSDDAAVTGQPCATAKQTMQLFLKFVRPDGQYRRDSLDMRGFLLGRRFDGAPRNQEILDVLTSHGYLLKHDRPTLGVDRPSGQKLREITEYVTHRAQSEGLRAALSELCPLESCQHGFSTG